jgi:hypothetical protein
LSDHSIIRIRNSATDQRQRDCGSSTRTGTEDQEFLHVLRPFVIAEADWFAGRPGTQGIVQRVAEDNWLLRNNRTSKSPET